jgi:hypothetical protein
MLKDCRVRFDVCVLFYRLLRTGAEVEDVLSRSSRNPKWRHHSSSCHRVTPKILFLTTKKISPKIFEF